MLAANQRRPRPEPNLIYHVPDKQSSDRAAGGLGAGPSSRQLSNSPRSPRGGRGGEGRGRRRAGPSGPRGRELERSDGGRFRRRPRAGGRGRSARQAERAPAPAGTPPASPPRRRCSPRRRPASIPSARKSPIPSRWSSRGRRCCDIWGEGSRRPYPSPGEDGLTLIGRHRHERNASVDPRPAQRSPLHRPGSERTRI